MKIFDGLYGFLWQNHVQNNCNTFFIDGTRRILIDPGHYHLFGHVQRNLEFLGISLDQIHVVIVTHGHPDHMEAVRRFGKSTLFAMNREEYLFIDELAGAYLDIPAPDFFLDEGELTIGEHTFQVITTPGHSPGSLCLYWNRKKVLFTGDVVFYDGIGRTDLVGGSGLQLKESIQRLSRLDVDYVLPGHGSVLVGKESVEKNFRRIESLWFNYLSV